MTGTERYVPVLPISRASALLLVLAPGLPSGTSRTPSAGRLDAGASDLIVMNAVPAFALSVTLPTNVWPARNRMVSPATAASIAACSDVWLHPLAHTVRVAASAADAQARKQAI